MSMPRPLQRVNSVLRALVEHEDDRLLAAPGRRDAELRGDRRLAGAGAADDQRAGAVFDAAAEQRVERRRGSDASFGTLPSAAVFGGDQPREDHEAALADHVVVIAAAKSRAAKLDDAQPPPLGAVLGTEMLEQDHAVRDALHVQIVIGGRHVVEQHHGALPAREDTASGPGSAAGSAAGCRRAAATPTASRTRRGSASASRRRRGSAWSSAASSTSDGWNIVYCSSDSSASSLRQQLADRHAAEVPAVRVRDRIELVSRFRERDVEHRLAAPARLRAGTAWPAWSCPSRVRLRPDTAVPGQSAVQDVIETGDAGSRQRFGIRTFILASARHANPQNKTDLPHFAH